MVVFLKALQCSPIELSVLMETFYSLLFNMVAMSHIWLLGLRN